MSSEFGSSWVYEQILMFHVRFARATPNNAIRFGMRPKRASNFFHPTIAPTLRSYVLDPENFIPHGAPSGICLPISVLLSILIKYEKVPANCVRIKQITKNLKFLHFHQFLQQQHPKEQAGISLENFQDFEKANTPLPLELVESCSSLATKKGLAINVFQAIPHKNPDDTSDALPTIYIFPTMLSTNNTREDFLQVDVLLDSADLRANHKHNDYDRSLPAHVLSIPNLLALLSKNNPNRSGKYERNTYYTHLCRSCCKIFSSSEDLYLHRNVCTPFPTGGNRAKKRHAKNQKVTRLFKTNHFTGAKEKNGLHFQRGHLFKCLLPLCISTLDLETLSNVVVPESSECHIPGGAKELHKVFCFSMAHISLYENHPLPPSLKDPRGLMFDPSKQSESEFAISLIKQIRTDLHLHSVFLNEALSKDKGTPTFRSLSPTEKAAFTLQKQCCFCGRHFGS